MFWNSSSVTAVETLVCLPSRTGLAALVSGFGIRDSGLGILGMPVSWMIQTLEIQSSGLRI